MCVFIENEWRHMASSNLATINSVNSLHYSDVKMGAMAYQITTIAIVCSTVYSGAD